MPIRIVSSTGGNWNATTAWTTGVAPTSVDTVEFTTDSGPITVNVASTIAGINYSNFQNTITFDQLLTIGGTVSLGTGGYTQSGGSGMAFSAGSINPQPITSNGVTWSRLLSFTGSSRTFTLLDQWQNTGTVSFDSPAATGLTINGATLGIGGDLNIPLGPTIQGTSALLFNGTGTWSMNAGVILKSIVVNTTGEVVSVGSGVSFRSGTFSYVAGTFTPRSVVSIGSSTRFVDIGNIFWDGISLSGTTTITSNSNFNITGTLSVSSAITWALGTSSLLFRNSSNDVVGNLNLSGAITFNMPNSFDVNNVILGSTTNNLVISGNTMSIWGTASINTTTGIVSGTTSIVLAGNSSISSSSTGVLRNNLFFNSQTTFLRTLYYNTGEVRYINGLISYSPTASLIVSGSTTFNTGSTSSLMPGGMYWNNISLSGTNQTFTHSSITRIAGTLSLSGTTGLVNNGSEIWTNNLVVTTAANNTGTTKINFTTNGGRWNHTSTGFISNPVEIDEPIIFGSNIYFRTGTISVISEAVGNATVATGNTFSVGATTPFNTPGLRFNNLALSGTTTINMLNGIIVNGTLFIPSAITITRTSGNLTFVNSSNSIVGSLVIGNSQSASTFTFALPNDLNVLDLSMGSLNSTNTINGTYGIYVERNFTMWGSGSNNTGSAAIIMTGTGSITQFAGTLRNNLTFNTPGGVQVGTNGTQFNYESGLIKYISGSVSFDSTINTSLGFTWSMPGVPLSGLYSVGAGTKTIALLSDMRIYSALYLGPNQTVGTTTFTGTYSLLFTNSQDEVTGSFFIGNTTFNLPNSITVLDLWTQPSFATTATLNGTSPNNIIYVKRDIYHDGSTSHINGNAKIVMNGTGRWRSAAAGFNILRLDMTIDTEGTISIGSYSTPGLPSPQFDVYFGSATFSYVKGNVVSTNAQISLVENCTLDTGTLSLDRISVKSFLGSSPQINIKSKLLTKHLRLASSCGFYGNFGFDVNHLELATTTNGLFLLQREKTYNVSTYFNSFTTVSQGSDYMIFTSNYIRSWSFPITSSPTMSYLNLSPSATQSLIYLSAQNIDSSGGKTIRTIGATLSNAINWRSVNTDIPSSGRASIN